MIFCATVDDVCYEGYSSEAHLASLLRFFAEQHVRATFLWCRAWGVGRWSAAPDMWSC